MKYWQDLLLRLGIALVLFILPYDIFYHLLLNPTLTLSSYFIQGAIHNSTSILIPGYRLELIPACIASVAYLLLGLLILTTKGIAWSKRVLMFLIGGIVIFAANTTRIILLAGLIQKDYLAYQTWHLFIWNIFSTAFVVLLWIVLSYTFKVYTVPVYSDFKSLYKKYRK